MIYSKMVYFIGKTMNELLEENAFNIRESVIIIETVNNIVGCFKGYNEIPPLYRNVPIIEAERNVDGDCVIYVLIV